MSARVVVPTWFSLQAVPVDWDAMLRSWPESRGASAEQLAKRAADGGLRQAVQLRWMIQPGLGLPLEAFQVWRRPTRPPASQPLIPLAAPLTLPGGLFPLQWDGRPMALVEVDVSLVAGQSLSALAYTGQGKVLDSASASGAGTHALFLRGDSIVSVLLSGQGSVTTLNGVTAVSYASLPDWQLVELVGLPVDSAWASTNYSMANQGPVTAPVAPPLAALRRLHVGQPLLGWQPTTDAGQSVTTWQGPNLPNFLQELRTTVLPPVIQMLGALAGQDPSLQAAYTVSQNLPPPATPGATPGPGTSQTQFPALLQLLLAAASDPFASLALGFGTALAPATAGPTGSLAAGGGGGVEDYMVTVHHHVFGLDLEFADFVIAPREVQEPAPVLNLSSALRGRNPPQVVDGPWTEAVLLEWTRVLPQMLTAPRTASYGVARADPAAAASRILLNPRRSGGWSPFAPARVDDDPGADGVRFVDLDLPKPPDPLPRTYHYSVAGQDLFGRYSNWRGVNYSVHDEPQEIPAILSQQWTVADAAGTVRAASLDLDFAWDWTMRSPEYVEFVGTLLPSTPHAPAPAAAPGAGMQMSLAGGPGVPLRVTFVGDVPSVPAGATVQCLDQTREALVACGSGQSRVRYYRLTVTNFSLDFAGQAELALVLYCRGAERLTPTTPGPWSRAAVARAASPVPPTAIVPPASIIWASRPDAAGISRARLSWADAGVLGYALYEATETGLLDAAGLGSPDLVQPLADRLTTLQGLDFATLRGVFIRVQENLVTSPSFEVALPRGSRVIHAYVVVAVSASQVEGAWPGSFFAVAVPHLAVPGEPSLRLRAAVDNSSGAPVPVVHATVLSRPGAPVARVELYRTLKDLVATSLESMGPPVASSEGAGWSLLLNPLTASGISQADYVDNGVMPGWTAIWYRAVAWSADNPGEIGTSSRPSPAASIVLPPAAPPGVSDLRVRETGSTATQVVVSWLCSAPVLPTPLGPHTLTLLVRDPAGGSLNPVLRLSLTLDATARVPDAAHRPAPLTAGGPIFRQPVTGADRYFAWVPRPTRSNGSVSPFSVAVIVSDPLGRQTELSNKVPWV